jgi:hypothetical protein
MGKIKGWLLLKGVAMIGRHAAVAIKDANIPIVNYIIRHADEFTPIEMLDGIAKLTGWKYSNGTVLEHLTSPDVLDAMGPYGKVWKAILETLQNQFDEKENE